MNADHIYSVALCTTIIITIYGVSHKEVVLKKYVTDHYIHVYLVSRVDLTLVSAACVHNNIMCLCICVYVYVYVCVHA